jgi:hypothetical protein
MKKIGLFLSILFVFGVITNSCISKEVDEIIGEDPDPDPDPDPAGATIKTFYLRFLQDVEMDSASVNTYAIPSFNGSIPSLNWSESEVAGFFLTGNNGALLYSNRKWDFNATAFIYTDTITTALITASGYGYTPYQSSISGTTVSYSLDNVQDQSANNASENGMDAVLEKNIFTISSPVSFELKDGMCAMTFKSIFAYLRLQVKKSDVSLFGQQRVKNVKLYVANTTAIDKPLDYALAGSYTIDVSKSIEASDYEGPVFGSLCYNEINSAVTGGNLISESYDSPYLWFVMNPVKIESSERLISIVETTSGHKIISQHDISDLKPNAIYTATIEANSNNTLSAQTIEISNGNISNCHVAPSAGKYRMYLNRRNEPNPLIGQSIDWLWASKEGGEASFDINELINPSSINYNATAGYVDFSVGTSMGKYTKGNVILALKNAANEIVWTWHIWITNDLKDVEHRDGKVFLDRNIGALYAGEPSSGTTMNMDDYGFVYQWGRKDPFPGADGRGRNESSNEMLFFARDHTEVNSRAKYPNVEWANDDVAKWTREPVHGTVDNAKRYPMHFITNDYSTDQIPADWLSPADRTRWSDDVKTNYDPCPSGYKVPSRNDLKSLYEAENDSDFTPGWYFESKNGYWKYYYYLESSIDAKTTLWPSAGMRLGRFYSGDNNGAQLLRYVNGEPCGYYWTSTPVVDGHNGGSYRVKMAGRVLQNENDFGDNADAYSIRCVKIETP